MKIRASCAAAVSLTLGLCPSFAAGSPEPFTVAATALGDEGSLYQVLAGTRGDLFPQTAAEDAGNAVLALDVIQPDGTHDRTLLPATGGPEVEGTPSAVFEDSSERLYVVWESKKSAAVSRLLLAGFDTDGWSQPIEISGDVSPLKDEPRVLIGRDRFALRDATGESQSHSRTVIHVLWREEGSAGNGLFYAPVILEAGRYIGWNPVVALADLETDSGTPDGAAAELLRTPVLAPGQDIYSAIVAFASPTTGRLIAVEARILPGEIGFLADDIRADIIEIGNRDRDKISALAKAFRSEVIDTAQQFNSDLVQHFADLARAAILDDYDSDPDQPPGALADRIRADIIEIGARLLGGSGGRGLAYQLLQVDPDDSDQGTGGSPFEVTHLLSLKTVADRPIPPLDGIPANIFVSEDGEQLLVAWLSKGKVYYTESGEQSGPTGEPWTPVQHLTLSERLGIPEAAAILESRLQRQR